VLIIVGTILSILFLAAQISCAINYKFPVLSLASGRYAVLTCDQALNRIKRYKEWDEVLIGGDESHIGTFAICKLINGVWKLSSVPHIECC